MSTFLDYLSGPNLTEIAASPKVRRGVPRPLPAALWQPGMNKPPGDKVQYTEFRGNRTGARLVSRMSPARAAQIPGAEIKTATALNVKELLAVDGDMIDLLKSSEPDRQARGRRELIRRIAEFMGRCEITRTNVVLSIFATGKLFWDADGNVLPNSTNAAGSFDFKVPLANQLAPTSANADAGKYAIGDWSDPTTVINAKLKALRKANLKANGFPLTTILYGENVLNYLLSNPALKDYFTRNQTFRDSIVMGNEIADGTLGWKWQAVETAFIDDGNGNITEWFGSDFIGVMPDVSDDWWEFVEGGANVPKTTAAIGQSAEAMLENVTTVNGPYSYVEMSTNPLSINQIIGDTFIALLKHPGVYYFGRCK